MAEGNYFCKKCRSKVRMEKIRYDSNGIDLVCVDCYNKNAGKAAAGIEKQRQENNVSSEEKIKIICTDCRYKFIFRKGSNVALRCPYCSGSRLVKDQTNVDELIKEVSQRGEAY